MTTRKEDTTQPSQTNQPAPEQKDQVPDDPGGFKAFQQTGHGAKASEHGTPLPAHAAAQNRAVREKHDIREDEEASRSRDAEARDVLQEAEAIQKGPEDRLKPKANEKPYVVASGAIAPLGNHAAAKREHGDRARLYAMGETVMLTAEQARAYVKKKLLDPYIPDDED